MVEPRRAFTREGEFAFPAWTYSAEDTEAEYERKRLERIEAIQAQIEQDRRTYEQKWKEFWKQEQSNAASYSHLLVLRMPRAWKMRTKALVGEKVNPANYARLSSAARDYRVRRSFNFKDCTVLRLTAKQAMLAKLSLDGNSVLVPIDRRIKWGSIKRTEMKLNHGQPFEQRDFDNISWAGNLLAK